MIVHIVVEEVDVGVQVEVRIGGDPQAGRAPRRFARRREMSSKGRRQEFVALDDGGTTPCFSFTQDAAILEGAEEGHVQARRHDSCWVKPAGSAGDGCREGAGMRAEMERVARAVVALRTRAALRAGWMARRGHLQKVSHAF